MWRTEQALGVSQWKDLFETKLAKRFPTFGAMLKVNSSTSGWGSCEGCDFTQNIFLNNTHKFALSSRNATTGAIIALYDDDALTEGAACIDGSGSVDAEWSDFQVFTRIRRIFIFHTKGSFCQDTLETNIGKTQDRDAFSYRTQTRLSSKCLALVSTPTRSVRRKPSFQKLLKSHFDMETISLPRQAPDT